MRLLCDTNPMAFGSTASLAAVLSELSRSGLPTEVIAMGRDVSLELMRLMRPDGGAIEVNVKDSAAVSPVIERDRPDLALVISNLSNLHLYRAAGLPVFFVDVLFWYGERKNESQWADFVEGFALDFPGVRARVRQLGWASPPTIVGPILRQLPLRATRPQGTLVNLGGVRSVFMPPSLMRPGLELTGQLLRELQPRLPDGEVVIAAGSDAIDMLRPLVPAEMVLTTMSPAEYDAVLQRSALLLTVPGLNAVMEGMAADIPMAFLPALNASQCLQLRRYQEAGVGAFGIELDRFVPLDIPERVSDEGALTAEVLAGIAKLAADPLLSRKMVEAVAAQVPHASELVPRRRAFIESLGPSAAPLIAATIERWWRERAP